MSTRPRRLAALDLGSNSFHVIVAEITGDGAVRTVAREKVMLRLGDGVGAIGRIGDDAQREAVDAVSRLTELSSVHGAEELVACATAAVREAENGSAFVDLIRAETGVDVRVISGEEEARLIFRAVQSSVDFGGRVVLGIDIGGGSVEFSVGTQASLHWVTSAPLGVGRLTGRFVSTDPITKGERTKLTSYVRGVLGPIADEAALHDWDMAVGTSGTLLSMARLVAADRGEEPHVLDGFRIEADELRHCCRTLRRADAGARAAMPGIEPRRVDLMPAAAVLVTAILDLFDPPGLTVSTWGLREGLVLERLDHPAFARAHPERVRARSVLALGRRHHFDEMHARQTARLSGILFDALHRRLGLDDRYRELLELAAMVHDVGTGIALKGHHKHGAYLVAHSELVGFEPDDYALLVALVRYHRSGKFKEAHPEYRALGSTQRGELPALVGLLRVADGLDRSRSAEVTDLDVRLCDDRIAIRLRSSAPDPSLDLWGARHKVGLLEKVLGVPVSFVGPDERLPNCASGETTRVHPNRRAEQ